MLNALRTPVFIFTLAAMPFSHAYAASATLQPALLVEQAASDLEQVRGEAVADTVLSYLNIEMIARFTLGQHARSMEDSDIAAFSTALKSFLHTQIARQSSNVEQVALEIVQTSSRNARDAIIVSRVTGFGDPLTLK